MPYRIACTALCLIVLAGCQSPDAYQPQASEYLEEGVPNSQDNAVIAAWTASQTDPAKIDAGLEMLSGRTVNPYFHDHFLETIALVVKLADQFEASPPDHPPIIGQSQILQGPTTLTTVIWDLLRSSRSMAYDSVEGDVLFRHLEPPASRPEWHKIWEQNAARLQASRTEAKGWHEKDPTIAVPPNVLSPAIGEPQ